MDPELPVAVPDIINYDDLVLREAQQTQTMLLHQFEGDDTFQVCQEAQKGSECRCDPEQKGRRLMTAVIGLLRSGIAPG